MATPTETAAPQSPAPPHLARNLIAPICLACNTRINSSSLGEKPSTSLISGGSKMPRAPGGLRARPSALSKRSISSGWMDGTDPPPWRIESLSAPLRAPNPRFAIVGKVVRFAARRKLLAFLLAWVIVSGVTVVTFVFIGAWIVKGFPSATVSATAVRVDSRGVVHLVFSDDALEYVDNADGSWTKRTLYSDHSVSRVALAVDSHDKLHAVFEASSRSNFTYTYGPAVEYLTNVDGSWVHRTLDLNGRAPAIAIDSHDAIHVAYSSFVCCNDSGLGNQSVRYATNAGGTWTNSTAWVWSHFPDNPPYFSELAVDSSGVVHVAYDLSGFLRYMTNVAGTWTREWLDARGTGDQGPGLAVDSSGRPHVLFEGVAASGPASVGFSLVHGVRLDGVWTFEAVDRLSGVCACSWAMALDGQGRVHAVYNDRGQNVVKYATNSADSWVPVLVESGNAVGLFSAITLDSRGRPYLTYYMPDSRPGASMRLATTVLGATNALDFLIGRLPTVLLEFLGLIVIAMVGPPIFRRVTRWRSSHRVTSRP